MNEETRKRMESARHNWRAFSTDDNGVCNEKPDDVFETGYTAAHNDAQGEIEKLKAENSELIEKLATKHVFVYKENARLESQLTLERAASAELVKAITTAVQYLESTGIHKQKADREPEHFMWKDLSDVLAAHHARQKERG